jgi:uncharacterized membrane protein YphA (DoxX/SURF4 family)
MLSLFPSFLTYSLFAPFLLRIVLAATILFFAYRNLKTPNAPATQKAAGALEVICAILLIIGLFTQAAALIVAIIMVVRLVKKVQQKAFLTDGVNYYLILLVIALSIIMSGAGRIAFDLPL